MTIDKDGLAAAARALYALEHSCQAPEDMSPPYSPKSKIGLAIAGAEAAITAYLSALPNTGDELVAELRTYQHWEGQTNLGTDCYGHPEICDRAADAIVSLVAERDNWRRVAERCKSEAESHAMEARTANSTIYEIYQVLSGATGEPGNWNGAEPARQYVAEAERLLAEARAEQPAMETFVRWLRAWTKARHGVWITHNTAKGAFNEYVASIGGGNG